VADVEAGVGAIASKLDGRGENVRVLRPPINENLVESLREWLDKAERGEIIGALLLGNMPGDSLAWRWSGHMPSSVAMIAFEWFKKAAFEEGT
jgi:hypothetical protein